MIDYGQLSMRGRVATLRAIRGESGGETLESILNEYGNKLRAELDGLINPGTDKQSAKSISGIGFAEGHEPVGT